MCWFKRLFCSTANIRLAPRRAFDRPIMLAARSVDRDVNSIFLGEKTPANLALKRRACDWLRRDYVLSPRLTVVDQAVSAYHPARENL
jgi:hypothetical protein